MKKRWDKKRATR